jgi:lysylphosphatidylglycerol synthetase-like protein (DUF2156 family)
MIDLVITWALRWGHVLGGALWLGGYAFIFLGLLPLMRHKHTPQFAELGHTVTRTMTYSGMATIFFGLMLVTRTRGFASIGRGEWGWIIVVCIVIAIALLGIGDGMLRPALRRYVADGTVDRVRSGALIGFVLSVLAIGLMTRALYATS